MSGNVDDLEGRILQAEMNSGYSRGNIDVGLGGSVAAVNGDSED